MQVLVPNPLSLEAPASRGVRAASTAGARAASLAPPAR